MAGNGLCGGRGGQPTIDIKQLWRQVEFLSQRIDELKTAKFFEESKVEIKEPIEFKEVTNVKVNHLFPFKIENKHENSVEIDWTSPPIYDEYFDEVFGQTKFFFGESLHHHNLDCSCQNEGSKFGFPKKKCCMFGETIYT